MSQQKPNTVFIYLALFGIAALAYWQIAFLQNSLKWDMIDCYLPWRYHVGECLQNGVFPFWNPYTHGGYPIHADLRSVWYPEAWIVGLTTGYSNLTLHLLFIVYLSLAGLGMFLLSRLFTNDWRAGFIAAVAYLLSGFFTGHGQEMFGIIAATWIPFVLYYFIRLQQKGEITDILRTALFAFLLVTGGYQAMWAILLYLMLTVFIVYLIRHLKENKYRDAGSLVVKNLLLVLLTGVSLTIIAVTYFQVSPHLGRLGGVSLSDAWFMPFSPQSCISFLLPFATVKDAAFYGTDLSMNNAYAGLVILVFSVLSLFLKRKLLLNVFLIFGLVSLLASFGEYTPVRGLLYHVFPLLDLFRHSSFFSYFAILAIIPGAATGIGHFLAEPALYRKKLMVIAMVLAGVIVILAGYSFLHTDLASFSFFKPAAGFPEWLAASYRHEHVLIHALIQLGVLSVFLILMSLGSFKRWTGLFALIAVEMFLAVQLNVYYTVADAVVSPVDLAFNLDQRPAGFPRPRPENQVSANTEQQAAYSLLWRNTNIYNKTVSFEGFNSFRLKNCESLADTFPDLAKTMLNNPLIYLSDHLIPESQLRESPEMELGSDMLFVHPSDFKAGLPLLEKSGSDTVVVTGFSPVNIRAEVSCSRPIAVTLLQASYPGWKVLVDGVETPCFVSNRMFISFICQPGKHRIEYIYSNPLVVTGFLVSYGLVFLMLIGLVLLSIRKGEPYGFPVLIGLGFVVLAVVGIYRLAPKHAYEKERDRQFRQMAATALLSDVPQVICNTDDNAFMESTLIKSGYRGSIQSVNLTSRAGLGKLADLVGESKSTEIALLSLYATEYPEARALFWKNQYGTDISEFTKSGRSGIFGKASGNKVISFENGFEYLVPGWKGNPASVDSAVYFIGRHSNRLDSVSQGSFSFTWTPGSVYQGVPVEVLAGARFLSDGNSGTSLIIQQRRNNEVIKSSSTAAEPFMTKAGEWCSVLRLGSFPDGLRQGDVIVAFFWSDGKSVCYIDDFEISIRPDSGK